mgnify:CR=1 FL=1|jgi:ATP-dependent Clp protease ATP-binding subunit ClpA
MDLSRELRIIMGQAFTKAQTVQNEYVTPEHVLYSIILNDEELVDKLEIDTEEIIQDLDDYFTQKVPTVQRTGTRPHESAGFNEVVKNSIARVESQNRNIVEVGDILISIFGYGKTHGNFLLRKYGVENESLEEVVNEIIYQHEEYSPDEAGAANPNQPRKKKSLLAEYTVELVQEAKEGRLDPIIGRSEEIERTVQILCRKKKNNPIHVGESGVGKCLHADEKIDLLVSDEMYEQLKEFI